MCISVLPGHIYMHHICAWCLQRPGKGIGFPQPLGIVVIDGCELGTEPGYSGRAVSAVNHGGIALAQFYLIFS